MVVLASLTEISGIGPIEMALDTGQPFIKSIDTRRLTGELNLHVAQMTHDKSRCRFKLSRTGLEVCEVSPQSLLAALERLLPSSQPAKLLMEQCRSTGGHEVRLHPLHFQRSITALGSRHVARASIHAGLRSS